MQMSPKREGLLSVEEYEQLRDEPGYRTELSRGLLVREPQPGAIHGEVTGRIYFALDSFVRERGLGRVTNQTGFLLATLPRTVRGPDVAFVRRDRVPTEPPKSFWPFAPDLAIEVASPSNSLSDLQEKVIEYFEAGTEQVWIIEPRTRTVTIYRSLSDITLLRETETIDGGDLLPGFSVRIAGLFEW
jgi:Uma2 family endonuclease